MSGASSLFVVPNAEKSMLTDRLAIACAQKKLPFSVLESGGGSVRGNGQVGLRGFVEAAIQIGQGVGSGFLVDIDRLMPQGDAVAASLSRIAALERRHDETVALPAAMLIGCELSSDGVKTKAKQNLRDISMHILDFGEASENDIGTLLPPRQ